MSQTCPYCFEPLDPRWVAFRCINPDPSACPPVEDLALQGFQRSPRAPRMAPVTLTKVGRLRGAPSAGTCTSCGRRTTSQVCVSCHNQLPSQFRAVEGRSIAMVGAKGAGKTHVIGVLVYQLQNAVGRRFDQQLTLQALDERTIKRYDEQLRRPLFEQGHVLPATNTLASNEDLRYPLVYQLKVGRQKLRAMNLVLFDTAGEDLNDRDLLDRDARYIAAADAVVMLLDPLQIPAVRERLSGTIPLPDRGAHPLDLVTRITDATRLRLELAPHKRIDRPLALAFSKLDAIRPLMDPDSPALAASRHDGGFDAADAEEVSESIRAHVFQWADAALDTFVSANWANVRWFGISALGRSPVDGQLRAGVAPQRVEDPLLWFLAEWGMISTKNAGR
ncbi:MAG: TRAFAC clade GTPase domain-containing protein [Solirubrobacteraceae bacterium]